MKRLLFIFMLGVIALSAYSQQDTVSQKFHMKNGAVYIGNVVKESAEQVTIHTDDGNKLTFSRDDIRRVVSRTSAGETPAADSLAAGTGYVEISAGFNGGETDIGANMYRLGIFRGKSFKRWQVTGGVSFRALAQTTLDGYTLISAAGSIRYFTNANDGTSFYIAATPGFAFNLSKNLRAEGVTLNVHGGIVTQLLNRTPLFAGPMIDMIKTGSSGTFTAGFLISVGF